MTALLVVPFEEGLWALRTGTGSLRQYLRKILFGVLVRCLADCARDFHSRMTQESL